MSKIVGSSSSSGTTVDDEKPPKPDLIENKFSDALRSRTVKIVSQEGPEFFVHEALLRRESEKFQKQLNGAFKEAQTEVIEDVDEPPELLGIFFEYLYREGWLLNTDINHTSQYVLLARLYCMGERLMAKSFKRAVFWKFETTFGTTALSDDEVVELLELVHTELMPRKRKEYPLRTLVLWYAASIITRLQKFPAFRRLVRDHYPELGGQILLAAGDCRSEKPSLTATKPKPKFKEEVEFL